MYIGKTPTVGNFQVCDAISVVNGQAAYTLQVGGVNVAPESANHMLVSLNGILQKPGSSFTISSSTMTFASNLATGDVIDFVQILGNVLDIGQPSDATVTSAKLSGNLVTPGTLDVNGNELILDADADTSITADTDDQIDFKTGGTDRAQIDSSGNFKFNSGFGSVTSVYGVRAWANLKGTDTFGINGSGGLSSATDVGTGSYRFNFATNMPDTNYAAVNGSGYVISTSAQTYYRVGMNIPDDVANHTITVREIDNDGGSFAVADIDRVQIAYLR